MRRWALIAVATLALAAPASGGRARAQAQVQVVAREFSFTLSRDEVIEGKVMIELANFGQDPHNLVVRKAGGKTLGASLLVAPAQNAELKLKLKRGGYVLYCSFGDHEARGMSAVLRVKRKKR